MYRLIFPSALLLLVACSGTKQEMLMPEKVSPDVYETLLENEYIKMLKVS